MRPVRGSYSPTVCRSPGALWVRFAKMNYWAARSQPDSPLTSMSFILAAATGVARRLSLRALRSLAFAEAQTGTTAICFDKFDAGQLKRPSKHR